MKTVKQYLLYVPTNKKDTQLEGNWDIEYYRLWDDLQGRAMMYEMQGINTKTLIEYTDGTKEEDKIII